MLPTPDEAQICSKMQNSLKKHQLVYVLNRLRLLHVLLYRGAGRCGVLHQNVGLNLSDPVHTCEIKGRVHVM